MASGILVNIGSDNGSLPLWRQAITWTDADLLSIGPSETKLSEICIKMSNFQENSVENVDAKWLYSVWASICWHRVVACLEAVVIAHIFMITSLSFWFAK